VPGKIRITAVQAEKVGRFNPVIEIW